jgi:CheY-like chemotaxis protein
MQLEGAGIKFCAARDGFQALELIKSHRPKILILDISLPGLNGYELIEAIRSDPELHSLLTMSIIIHTSLDLTREDEMRLTLNGKTQFLTKSRATEDLGEIVSKIFSVQD